MRFFLIPAILALAIIVIADGWIYGRLRSRIRFDRVRTITYWLPSAFFALLLLFFCFFLPVLSGYKAMVAVMWLLWLYVLIYIPKLFFVLFDALGKGICRLFRLRTRVFSYIGLTVAASGALLFLSGAFVGRTAVHVENVTVTSPRVPEQLDGFRIVHFSDAHIGNWGSCTGTLEKTVALIDSCHTDMVVFTGDFVNNISDEITPRIIETFRRLQAPCGVYAILGNHDYGDYHRWDTPAQWRENLARTKAGIRACGFDLLLNESRLVATGDTALQLVGVENVGKPPFRRYGDLPLALSELDTTRFTVLLSHDPTHWRREVLDYPFIDLTLSGHTHAGQSGVARGRFRWSPSSWLFDEWEGLYRNGTQYLYVNRGLGYVGLPVRIGMSPEITCITLRRGDLPQDAGN